MSMQARCISMAAFAAVLCVAPTYGQLLEEALAHYNVSAPAPERCGAAADLVTKGFHGKLRLRLPAVSCRNGSSARAGCSSTCDSSSQGSSSLLVLQALPSGVFADPYELATWQQDLPSQLQPAAVQLFGAVDLESIQSAASPQLVSIMVQGCTAPVSAVQQQTLSVPLHARYHLPARPEAGTWCAWLAGPMANISLPQPRVLTQHAAGWSWLCVQPDEDIEDGRLGWQVPVGNLEHTALMSGLTYSLMVCGAAVVTHQLMKQQRPG